MSLEPATFIIGRLGGVSATARGIGVTRQTVWKWVHRSGTIPQRHHVALLNLARSKDVPLTAADFLPRQMEDAA